MVSICVRSTAIDNSQSTTNANSNQTKIKNQLTIYQKTVLTCVLYQDIPQPLRTSQSTRSRICHLKYVKSKTLAKNQDIS